MDNVYGAVIMTQVISKVHSVHLTNAGQRQTAVDPQTRPTACAGIYSYFTAMQCDLIECGLVFSAAVTLLVERLRSDDLIENS